MLDSPPRSLLITPDLRRRLQQQYEEAQRLAARARPDFRRVHDLLAQCVQADPGNILYLDALLANLRRRDEALTGWWNRWWRGRRSAAKPVTTEHSLLQNTPHMLWARPDDPPLLRNAAAAAAHFDFDQVELRYLQAAREKSPDDVETMRALARALTRQGRFEDAIGPWCAVLALQPGDKEGQQAMDDLRGVHQASQEIATPDHDSDALLERARRSQDAGDFAAAEACLAKAQSALGRDLRMLAMREDLRIRHAEQRLEIARRRAVSDQHPKAQRLVQRLADEQTRLEIEILNARAERLPGDAGIRIDLARRLKQAGNFSGAVQRLEEALRLKPDEPAALVELGECWQHLRQFAKALELYERAIANAENSAGAMGKLAHYRAGVLAAALGQTDAARDHFRLVLGADPAYKDAHERLDKLGPN